MTRTAMITVAALALVISGCMGSGKAGSNSTPETTTDSTTTIAGPPPVTHRQFVKRLDGLCRLYSLKGDRLNKRYADVLRSTDYAAIADVYRRAERIQAPWRAAVVRLEVPPNDRRRFRRYLALADRIDGLFHREIRALRRQDEAEFARIDGLITQTRNQRTTAAVDLGLQVCGG